MNNWGFTIHKGRLIDLDCNNKKLARLIDQAEPSSRLCYSCGSCSATCSTGNFTDFSFRKLIVMIRRGEDQQVSELISECMLCGKCILVCPRGVNTRNIIYLVKKETLKPEYHEN